MGITEVRSSLSFSGPERSGPEWTRAKELTAFKSLKKFPVPRVGEDVLRIDRIAQLVRAHGCYYMAWLLLCLMI